MPVSSTSMYQRVAPTSDRVKAFSRAQEILPLFKRLALRVESACDQVSVLLQGIESPDPVLIIYNPQGVTCTCSESRNSFCYHAALMLLAFGRPVRDYEADLLAANVCCSLGDFGLDKRIVRNRAELLLQQGAKLLRPSSTDTLEVYQQEGLRLSLLRNRVVAFMCDKCGDVWEGSRKAACECVIDFVCKLYVNSINR